MLSHYPELPLKMEKTIVRNNTSQGKKSQYKHNIVTVIAFRFPQLNYHYISSQALEAIHYIGHAMGFFHEHIRSDRDNYIVINYENIRSGRESRFETTATINTVPYDYTSNLHYSPRVRLSLLLACVQTAIRIFTGLSKARFIPFPLCHIVKLILGIKLWIPFIIPRMNFAMWQRGNGMKRALLNPLLIQSHQSSYRLQFLQSSCYKSIL